MSPGNETNTPQIKRLEKELSKRELQIDEKAPDRIDNRDYLAKRYGENTLILDDDPTEYKEKHNNLYLVDCETGLTAADAKKNTQDNKQDVNSFKKYSMQKFDTYS